jgi:nucleotide-binding universal stress UspA family protein
MKIKRILVPVDFSKHSLKALDYAADFAKAFEAELHVLFVLEPIAYATPADFYAGMATQISDLITEQRRSATRRLAQLQTTLGKKGITAKPVLRSGIAYQEIIDAAKKLKADLIIHATHGRTGLSHLVMGSVAERVVRAAPCPVLTLRSDVAKKLTRPGKARS